MDHQLGPRLLLSARTLNTLVVCPLYISAAYHHLDCFRLLLQAGAQPDFNYTGPVCQEALTRGLASCLLDAVLRHGCEVAFVHLLLDHGANPALVPWVGSELEAPNRRKVDPEALQIFLEAKSEYPCKCDAGIDFRRIQPQMRYDFLFSAKQIKELHLADSGG